MLPGFDKLAQRSLILLSENKLISNASYKDRLCDLKIRCVSFIIKESWMAPYIGATNMMYLQQIVCYTTK